LELFLHPTKNRRAWEDVGPGRNRMEEPQQEGELAASAHRLSFGIRPLLGKNCTRRAFTRNRESGGKAELDMKGGNVVSPLRPIKALSRMLAWLALAPTVALGQGGEQPGLNDLMQARNYAMGGAYRALGTGSESVDGNPAAMGMRKRYEISLAGAFDTHTKFGFGALTLYDTQTSDLGAGISYHLISVGQDPQHRVASMFTLALSYPLSQSIFLGASGHYVIENGAIHSRDFTMDAGIALKMTDALSASLSGHNLINTDNPDLKRYYAFGLGYSKGPFTWAGDVRADFTSNDTQYIPGTGFEYVAGGAFPLRAGYSFNSRTSSNYVSGGLGLLGDGAGIDLAYRHEFGGAESRLIALTIKLQL